MDASVTVVENLPVVDVAAELDPAADLQGVGVFQPSDEDVIESVTPRVLRLSTARDQVLMAETVILQIDAEAVDAPDAAVEIRGNGDIVRVLTLTELQAQNFRVPFHASEPGTLTFDVRWIDVISPEQDVDPTTVASVDNDPTSLSVVVADGAPLSCVVNQISSLDSEPQRLISQRGGASDESIRTFSGQVAGGEADALIASDADAIAGNLRTSIEGSVIWMAGESSEALLGGYSVSASVSAEYDDRWVLQAVDSQRTGESVQAAFVLNLTRSALGVAGSGVGGDDVAVTRVIVRCNGQETAYSARQMVLLDGSLSEPSIAVEGDLLLTDKLQFVVDTVLGTSLQVSVVLTSWIDVQTGVNDGLPMDLSLMQTEATLRWGGLLGVTDSTGAAVDVSAWTASGMELPQPDQRSLLVGQTTDDLFGPVTVDAENSEPSVVLTTDRADVLFGRNGADRLDGAGGADVMLGGLGDDLMLVDDVGDRVIEQDGQGNDTVWSAVDFVLPDGVENLVLLGTQATASPAGASARVASNAATRATGNAASNWIAGNDGNNTLDGAGNADTLIGGPGDDTYYVDNPGDMVVEQPNEGEADVVMSAITTVLPTHVENLVMLPSAHHGSGNALNNALTGNAADNWLDGAAGDDIVMGLEGDDTLEGGDGADRLDGGAGNDTLTGGAGQDQLIGGAGNDAYWLGADDASDTIVELAEGGVDTVYSRVSLTLVEHIENLTLFGDANLAAIGNAGENWLVGNDGNNWMTSGAAEDLMAGGRGSDTYVYRRGDGKDRIQEQAEPDASASQVDQDLLILEAVYAPDTWVARQGDDLIVTVFGPAETTAAAESVTPSTVAEVGQIKVLGWYAEQAQRLERIELADGVVLNSGQAERLVDALAMLVRPDQGSAGQSLDNLLAIDNAWIGVLYGI